MEIDPLLLQFGGSLVAIVLLAWFASALKLGDKPKLASHSEAARAAGEVADGFTPIESAIAHDGAGALLKDANGQIMLLKTHGVHFAGRILSGEASATASDGMLIINTGEARFGSAQLALDDVDSWVVAINQLGRCSHDCPA